MIEFVLYPTVEELVGEFCRRLEELTAAAQRRLPLALTGGGSAAAFYDGWSRLGQPKPEQFEFYWSDERLVPLTDPDSNFKLANDHLFTPCHTPAAQLHAAPTSLAPAEAARAYAATIREQVAGPTQFLDDRSARAASAPPAGGAEVPRFPLIVLGLGEDGHTGSLFPGRDPYEDDALLVRTTAATKEHPHQRLTFTPRLINAAEAVWFVVTGEGKAQAVHDLAVRQRTPTEVPALVADPEKTTVVVFADRAAARMI